MFLRNRNNYYLNNNFHLIEGCTNASGQYDSTYTVDEQNLLPSDNVNSV